MTWEATASGTVACAFFLTWLMTFSGPGDAIRTACSVCPLRAPIDGDAISDATACYAPQCLELQPMRHACEGTCNRFIWYHTQPRMDSSKTRTRARRCTLACTLASSSASFSATAMGKQSLHTISAILYNHRRTPRTQEHQSMTRSNTSGSTFVQPRNAFP